ncbi:DUF6732 family protein [Pseudooceanicola spongiae]
MLKLRPVAALAALMSGFVAPMPAAAHPGHLADVAGHGHWLGAAALGAAIAIGLWKAYADRKDRDPDAETDADAEDLQEA